MNVPLPHSDQSIALAWLSLGSRGAAARHAITTRVLVLKPVNSHGNAEIPRFHAGYRAAFHVPGSISLPT
jgi:hypothetical protein